jgi:hypothetical protein
MAAVYLDYRYTAVQTLQFLSDQLVTWLHFAVNGYENRWSDNSMRNKNATFSSFVPLVKVVSCPAFEFVFYLQRILKMFHISDYTTDAVTLKIANEC